MRNIPNLSILLKWVIGKEMILEVMNCIKKHWELLDLEDSKIVSSYTNSFGMNIISYEKNYCSAYKEDYDYVEFVENLDLIAKYSDVITVHINYVKANHNFIDINFFKKCKKSAYLINTSRGEVINENDLIYSLKNKIIKGAALDVIHNEHSFDKNSKLLEYVNENSNLIIAPHIGGNTFESFKNRDVYC